MLCSERKRRSMLAMYTSPTGSAWRSSAGKRSLSGWGGRPYRNCLCLTAWLNPCAAMLRGGWRQEAQGVRPQCIAL
eukprot:4221337-Heterocapsa_arctica.AAC.1